MWLLWIEQQEAIFFLHRFSWMVFTNETKCVYSAVRGKSLNIIPDNFCLEPKNVLFNPYPANVENRVT